MFKNLITALIICCTLVACNSQNDQMSTKANINKNENNNTEEIVEEEQQEIVVGAARLNEYLPMLEGKTVGLVVNQTSRVGEEHIVDRLLKEGISIKTIFAPEHGFRGKADAGATIKNGRDTRTGLPIISLYGKRKKPYASDLSGIDVVLFDIQDVGARFYTYISTMHYVMEACAENNKQFIVLDRPNPNGHYVDGPIREAAQKSFVGMHPIPIVHGMTVGEYAQMVNGEGWLNNGIQCDLTVVRCENYDHTTFYDLPVKPSPNLPNIRSIYLYPSLCLFEGTIVSVGRGTETPFQIFGHPDFSSSAAYAFTPRPTEGATSPKCNGKVCYGYDMTVQPIEELRDVAQLDLSYLIDFYQSYPNKSKFFNSFFKKLAGTTRLQQQIQSGMSASEIRATWQDGLQNFKATRKEYLLYADFE